MPSSPFHNNTLTRDRRSTIRRRVLLGLLLLGPFLATWAQGATTDDFLRRLPEQTLFYIHWHDLSHLPQLRATNPLLRFLDSPEMKANWRTVRNYRRGVHAANEAGPEAERLGAGREDTHFRKLAILLNNPGFLAFVVPRDDPGEMAGPRKPSPLYLYDMTGMEEALAALEASFAAPGQTRQTYNFEGVTLVETVGAKGATNFQAHIGRWLVGGGDRNTVEAWIRAVQAPPARSLKDTHAYRYALHFRPEATQVEIFVNPGVLAQLPEASAQETKRRPTGSLKELVSPRWIEDWELFLFTATFEDDRTRYDAHAIQSPGSTGLAEVVAPSVSVFPSLDFVPPDASSYAVVELDLAAVWRFLQEVLRDMPPQSRELASNAQGMAEELLGIGLEELVSAWGREFAQLSYAYGRNGVPRTLRALELRDQQVILTALRALVAAFGPTIDIEELPGHPDEDIAFFRLGARQDSKKAPPGPEPQSDSDALYVVVTDKWLLIGRSREDISQALARGRQGGTFSEDPLYQSLRGRFPSALSTFSFVDAERLLAGNWAADVLGELARSLMVAERKLAESGQTDPEGVESQASPQPERTFAAPPELEMPLGYLKWWVSGTYRDQAGLHHIGYIE